MRFPPPGVPQPSGRYPLPNGVAGPVPPLPNAHINGFTPAGPPLFSTPPFGSANPVTQPNTVPGPSAPPSHPGQSYSGGMAGRASLGSQHRLPDGGPPYQSPTIPLFSQSQGYPQQPPAGPMSLFGRSPYMSTINRAAMPPSNGLQPPQGPIPVGSSHPTPTLAYQVRCHPLVIISTLANDQLIAYWFVSIKHYTETTNPRPIVNANV